jgi:hypothetical protein
VATLATGVGYFTAWTFRTEVRGLVEIEQGRQWPRYGSRTPSFDGATSWLRHLSNIDSIVASNTLCKGLPSSGYVLDFPATADCLWRNSIAIISANSQRSAYLEVPAWSTFSKTDLGDVVNQRYRDSILFATNNDPNSHERMIRDGVDYFVVDLGQTTLRDWEPRGTIRYQDDHYAVVELNN